MASKYMNSNNQNDIRIQDSTSTTELLMIFKCTANTIMITGTQITTQEFNRNLHLIMACLHNHLRVSHKFEKVRLILFKTASRAEQSFNTI